MLINISAGVANTASSEAASAIGGVGKKATRDGTIMPLPPFWREALIVRHCLGVSDGINWSVSEKFGRGAPV